MCNHKLEDKLNPKDFEDKIYKNWEEKGYFRASVDEKKKPYTIVIPPPNITGRLHMGHALDETLQDILIRYKRMSGYNALWVPGTDHAAIATEAKIVEKLKSEGTSKEEIGREEFLKRAWEWKREYGGIIISQIKKLGCSCDWEKERFTMDEGLSNAVLTVFENLYHKGLIYRGKRMINWCPTCNTSISDAEVEFDEEETKLWHIKYPTKDGSAYIVVATTRPETMLGDTAIAVHPKDERYKDIIGKTVVLPIMNKEIPVIADEFVEMEFGTGAVKITPAHDMNDYEAGLRHGLDIIEVFDENFKMGNLISEYQGMDLLEARKCIVEKLRELDLIVKIEDYKHNVGKCYRCSSKIEPKISEQWFLKMDDLAKPAIDVVKNKEIHFIPERFEKIYYNWMENIKDWCISRQLWWGHRIPAYYCKECNHMMVSKNEVEKCTKCGSLHVHQDEDTLDTWFSSALWPFSVFGWPEKTKELDYFYPTSTLVTGYDIIFFWVARMIFSGLEHMGEIPFQDVYYHGLIRDSQGRKMSKSLGNGIDPLEIINQYGADALRFSIILGTTPGNDIRFGTDKIESAANFANKIWNASKFVLMNLEGMEIPKEMPSNLCAEDKWILSKLNTLIKEVKINLGKYELGIALDKIYTFLWNEFCDWYIEIVKPRLYNKENTTRIKAGYVLNKVLGDCLKLLHPFMPFITEEVYTKLYHVDESIMISEYPEYNRSLEYREEEINMEQIKEVIVGIRNVRTNMNVHPSKKSKLIFIGKEKSDFLKNSEDFIKKLGFADGIVIEENENKAPANSVSIVTSGMKVLIPFEELVDIEEEKQRLQKEIEKIMIEKTKTEGMLSNPGFLSKAPEAKIKEEKEKLAKFNEMIATIEERQNNLVK